MMNKYASKSRSHLPCGGKSHGSKDSDGAWVIKGDHESKINHRGPRHTLPFKFQVPTKHTHFLVVEYSDDLGWKNQHCYGDTYVVLPLLKSCSNVVMDWIIYGDLRLTTQISLDSD